MVLGGACTARTTAPRPPWPRAALQPLNFPEDQRAFALASRPRPDQPPPGPRPASRPPHDPRPPASSSPKYGRPERSRPHRRAPNSFPQRAPPATGPRARTGRRPPPAAPEVAGEAREEPSAPQPSIAASCRAWAIPRQARRITSSRSTPPATIAPAIVERQVFDPVIGQPPLRKVVGADALGPVRPRADLRLAGRRPWPSAARLRSRSPKSRARSTAHGDLAVAVLGFLGTRDHDPRGEYA